MKPTDEKSYVECLSDPAGVEFNPSGVELNTLDDVYRRFHLRLMTFMPFGHVWRPPPDFNLAPMGVGGLGSLMKKQEGVMG